MSHPASYPENRVNLASIETALVADKCQKKERGGCVFGNNIERQATLSIDAKSGVGRSPNFVFSTQEFRDLKTCIHQQLAHQQQSLVPIMAAAAKRDNSRWRGSVDTSAPRLQAPTSRICSAHALALASHAERGPSPEAGMRCTPLRMRDAGSVCGKLHPRCLVDRNPGRYGGLEIGSATQTVLAANS